MNQLIVQIIFSIALLPANLCCAFWLFREALSLTGMTFQQFLGYSSDTVFPSGRAGLRRRRRFLTRFSGEEPRTGEIHPAFMGVWILHAARACGAGFGAVCRALRASG